MAGADGRVVSMDTIQHFVGQLEDLAQCPLCLGRCQQPRSLPCQHFFCVFCLDQYISKTKTAKGVFKCPNCRESFTEPPGGTYKYPNTYAISGLTEVLDNFIGSNSDGGSSCGSVEGAEAPLILNRPTSLANQTSETANFPDSSTDIGNQVKLTNVAAKALHNHQCVGQFRLPYKPSGICCTPEGFVIVCEDSGSRVNIYSNKGQHQLTLQTHPATQAWDVAYHSDCVYVTDLKTQSLLVFYKDGTYQRSIYVGFQGRAGVSVTDDWAYVTDSLGSAVFQVNLNLCRKSVNLFVPATNTRLALDSPSFVTTNQDQVAISCTGSHQVHALSPQGLIKYNIGSYIPGRGPNQFKEPCGVAMDDKGALFIADHNNYRIHVNAQESGELLGHIGLYKDNLRYPVGISVDNQGHVFVACTSPYAVGIYEYKLMCLI